MKNVFNNPQLYRNKILNCKNLLKYNQKEYNGKSLICVFFTSYCCVGCPFCFFKSPIETKNEKDKIESKFTKTCTDKFIEFANKSNVGYLQISGGGEPFLEKDTLLKCIEKINADHIFLITSGYWAYNKQSAVNYLEDIVKTINKRSSQTEVTIRLSVSKYHSIKLKDKPLLNLINIFDKKYKNNKYLNLIIKTFENDDTLTNIMENNYNGYKLEFCGDNISNDKKLIKIMPKKYLLILPSGYQIVVGKSRIFNPSLKPNMNDENSIRDTVQVYDEDLEFSQNFYPSLVFDDQNKKGFDWIVEYNGNVCTWQNRIPDNLMNLYEDSYEDVVNITMNDLISASFIEKGSKYREGIINEVSVKTVKLMKAVSIRDYAGNLLFNDEKITLYYNLRILQDYICENRINMLSFKKLPKIIKKVVALTKDKLIELYKKSNYSVINQELKNKTNQSFKDFSQLAKLGHFELNKKQQEQIVKLYNKFYKTKYENINEIPDDLSMESERRITKRIMKMKRKNKDCYENISI